MATPRKWRCCESYPCVCGYNAEPPSPTPTIGPDTIVMLKHGSIPRYIGHHYLLGVRLRVEGRDDNIIHCVRLIGGQPYRASIPLDDLEVVS